MNEIDSLREQIEALEKWTQNELKYLMARVALLEDYRHKKPVEPAVTVEECDT